jgi:hypothetical protein
MRRLLFILLMLALSITMAWSQATEETYRRWSIGVSAGDVFHHLFNGDEASREYPAFMLEYYDGKKILQAGFRLGYNRTDTEFESFLDTEVSRQMAISGQLAWLKSIFSENRWNILAGIGYRGGYSREDIYTDSGFDRVTTRRLQWNGGAGPMADIRFFVHPRISLGVQAGIVYNYSHAELQELFTNFPEFDNTKEKSIEQRVEILEPATIHFRFHF